VIFVLIVPFDRCITRYDRNITADFKFCGYVLQFSSHALLLHFVTACICDHSDSFDRRSLGTKSSEDY